MRPGLDSVRNDGGHDWVDRAVRGYLQEWNNGDGLPQLEAYWGRFARQAGKTGDPALALSALVKADLQRRYERGERPTAADYLRLFPALLEHSERVLSLVYEEFCLLEEWGERPDPDQFCERYPDWKDSLASQLRYHRVLSQVVGAPPPPRFPAVGEHFEEFLILRELGRGGAARVYLAHDESLGNRDVVLKVSADRGSEPSILGRLEHPNIVTVHSVVFQAETHLRGLCMPYRPGLPLDEVIRKVNPASHPRSARALRDALGGPPADPSPESLATPGWKSFPNRGTHADAVAWVVATLAKALHHAHGLGVFHRDVKPANVLLTYRDGPQLLDFNLAHDPSSADEAEAALRGGTLPYMAPEQLAAFLDPERWDGVGAAADLYSLGLVLREMLTGQAPDAPDPALPPPRAIQSLLDRRASMRTNLHGINPRTPHALEAVAARCLTFEPADRYPDAASLADDLQRFIDRRPLLHVPNPSRLERLNNWARRNVAPLCAAAAVVLVAVVLWANYETLFLRPTERRTFLEATSHVESNQIPLALRRLATLIRETPDSPLLTFYYAAALNKAERFDDSDFWLSRTWQRPEAESALTAWGRDHPGLARFAEELGDVQVRDRGPITKEILNDFSRKAPSNLLADPTLRLADKLAPNRPVTLMGLANLAERWGDYERSIAILEKLPEAAQPASTPGLPVPKTSRLPYYQTHARVITKWAQSLLKDQGRGAKDFGPVKTQLIQSVLDLRTQASLFEPGESSDHLNDINFILAQINFTLGDIAARTQPLDEVRKLYGESLALLALLPAKIHDTSYYKEFRTQVEGRVKRSGSPIPH